MKLHRLVLASVGLAAVSLGAPAVAVAQLATFDLTNAIQNTSTALNTAAEVKNSIEQLARMKDQLEYMAKNTRVSDLTTFNGVMNLYSQGRSTYDAFQGNRQALAYQAQNVRDQYGRLFPDRRAAETAKPSTHAETRKSQQDELRTAAQVAMTAQANQAQLQENARLAKNLSTKSASADGEVRQMQVVLEAILLLNSQITTLTQMLSASERLRTTESATEANQRLLGEEMNRRLMQGYTNRGAPPRVRRTRP